MCIGHTMQSSNYTNWSPKISLPLEPTSQLLETFLDRVRKRIRMLTTVTCVPNYLVCVVCSFCGFVLVRQDRYSHTGLSRPFELLPSLPILFPSFLCPRRQVRPSRRTNNKYQRYSQTNMVLYERIRTVYSRPETLSPNH